MSFPVYSTSLETKRIARAIRVLQRRTKAAAHVTSCGVYACKQTVGTTLYSAHAQGDAGDLMIPVADSGGRKKVALAVVADATRRTVYNRGKPTEVQFVIYNDKQWTRNTGWSTYTGVAHTNHVHVGCSFSTTKKPACAGGSNLDVPYVKAA